MQRARRTTDNRLVLPKRTVILLSVVTGVALELGVYALSGRREAWDRRDAGGA